MANRQSNNLTSSISVLAITIGLVAGQSVTQKSLAQFATSPAPTGVISINGAGASTVTSLFVGTVDANGQSNPYPFGSKGSWLNVFGVGNPASLNNNVPPAFLNYPNGTYGPVVSNDTFRYAPVGSGTGLTAFFTQTPPPVPAGTAALNNLTILRPVSFAVSDDPLTGTQVEQLVSGTPNSGRAVQVPVVGVGIALTYNRTGLNIPAAGLRLSRPTYCAILNGTITNWNDARIRADNGGVIIAANRSLRVVRRSDNSGSTFVLSTHLNTACKSAATPGLPAASVWNRGVGTISVAAPAPAAPNTVVWPSGFLSASGGSGVAAAIAANPGAVGYVDSATRLARNLPAALLRNRSGAYVGPTTVGIQHALSGGTIVRYGTAPANRLIRIDGLADPTVSTAYPISTATYTLFYDRYSSNIIATHIRAFINWSLANAVQPVPPVANSSTPTPDQIAISRGYAPLPNNIKTVSRTVVGNCVDTATDTSPCTP